jgi:2-keto-4-pentenoate hydratase/2-oxohepta-3-ene-1,7-dioic acid hydratase in catechol pathway
MRVATVEVNDAVRWGVLEDDALVDARDLAPSLRDFLAGGGDVRALRGLRGERVPLDGAAFLPPVPEPSKIWCCGLNYDDYRQMLGLEFLPVPTTFLKASTTLVGQDAEVGVPAGYGSVFDEWELAAVVGRTLREASPEEAEQGLFGYTIVHDLVLHDLELTSREYQQWAKNVDGFTPCGPWVVTADELDVRGGLGMRRRLNGELLSESVTTEMHRQPWDIASFISTFSTLLPGDLICTGTPPTGPCHGGDVIEGEVEGIGILRAHLKDRRLDSRWQVALEPRHD